MLQRAYDKIWQKEHPAYINCSVDKRWHNFQNFAKWCEDNYTSNNKINWELDKDILVKGNKIYSPENCDFVPQEINNLFIRREKERGDLPIGVTYSKNRTRFRATVNKKRIGTFDTIEEAFQAYRVAKEKRIKEFAHKWKPFITERIYNALINYQVEITD